MHSISKILKVKAELCYHPMKVFHVMSLLIPSLTVLYDSLSLQ